MIFIIVHGTKLQYLNIVQGFSLCPSVLDEMGVGGARKQTKTYSEITEHLSKFCFYDILLLKETSKLL